MRRIYLDNAATSFPKPPGVAEAVLDYLTNVGASAGRGAYREAVESGRLLDSCRTEIRALARAAPDDAVIFTLNGTDALNLAIKGCVNPGQHVVTTSMDHNSVLRPLTTLEERQGVSWTAVQPDPQTTLINPAAIERAMTPQTALVAINHASNVTGALQPIARISDICRRRGVPLLVDAAQSMGHVPSACFDAPMDLLAFPGHKGLLGPLGTGVLVIRAAMVERLRSLREGGTGSLSEQPRQPQHAPDKFEAGSHNAVGLAGLLAALRWIHTESVAALAQRESALAARMLNGLERLQRENRAVHYFGPRDPDCRVAVFSVLIDGLEPAELSALLETHYGLLTRSGLHCAPLAHRTIGTDSRGGTCRLSFGAMNTTEDVDAALAALSEIAAGASVQ
ncbi:putative cysteine desulfurase [Phycisphaerae bacterium RAS1]|nr:putative cysteine desulfurase [Phycisphaerae bacterium RAS1]